MHDEAWHILGGKQQVDAERRSKLADCDFAAHRPVTGHEMARLVEFAVVWQVQFGHHAQQPATVDRERAIIERAGVPQRRTDQQERHQIGRSRDDIADHRLDRIEQGGLMQ